MAISDKNIEKIEKFEEFENKFEKSLPYLTSDEKSSTLREPFTEIRNTGVRPNGGEKVIKPWVHFVSGGLGGMCGALFTCPFDVVKTRLQSSVYRDAYKSKFRVTSTGSIFKGIFINFSETILILKNVYKIEGAKALFKGLGPNLIGVIPARSINFFTYGYTKSILKNFEVFKDKQETSFLHLLAGINAGVITSTVTNPIWLIKTRLQLDKSTKNQYKNSIDCIYKIIKNEGIFSLYKGLSASYLGSIESTLQWILYEQVKSLINKKSDLKELNGIKNSKIDEIFDWFARSGGAGFAKLVASLITYPHEVIRTRLRQAPMKDGELKYHGLINTFKIILKEEGFISMYGGLTPHLMRTVPNSMIMFGTWEIFTTILSKF